MGIAVSKKTFNLKVKELENFKTAAADKEKKLKEIGNNLKGEIGKLIHNLIEHIDTAKSFIIMTNNIASTLESYSKTLNETASKQLEELKDTIKDDIDKIKKSMSTLTDEGQKGELSELLKTIESYETGLEKAVKQDEEGDVVDDNEGNSTGGTGGTEFGKRKRRRRFGSLYCPKAIKGAYGIRKPSKTSKKFKKEIKRRRKTTKRRKTVKRKKPVKRRKTTKRRKNTKRRKRKKSSPNSLSGIFNIINPNSIGKILQENPDIMEKINDLRQLKETGSFNPKELVVIAALSTLSDMTVQDASNQFSMLKGSGMSTDSIFDQAMGSSTPPVPKKSFMQGLLGGYGRRKRKVKRKRKKVKRKRKKVKRKRKKVKKKKKVSKKPSAALKRLCKKHKVRLTVKRGKKRVYKSEKVLKKQCKTAMKKKK